MLNPIKWMAENFSITQERDEAIYLHDRWGTPFYRLPSRQRARFEIVGQLEWEGQAWSKEKADGLIPFINQKLREYEDGFAV